MLDAANLPYDVAALKAMLIAGQAREMAKDVAIANKDEHIARKDERIERLEKLVAAFKQAAFGRKSEKTEPDQFDLAFEDLETAIAVIHAEDEADVPCGNRVAKPRAIRGHRRLRRRRVLLPGFSP
nr:transposase [Rhizobium sp. Leaf321]